jgi:hypothetical protein
MVSNWLRSFTGAGRRTATRSWAKGLRKQQSLQLELLETRDCPSLSVGNNQDIGNQTGSLFDPSIAVDPANSNHEFTVFQDDPATNPGLGYTYASVGTTVQGSTTWSTRQFAQGDDGGDGLPGGAMEAHAAFDANGYLYVTYLAGNDVYSDKLTGATPTTMQDTHANWYNNEWAGLNVTAGGHTVSIQSNTSNTLTLTSSWTPPSAGSSYVIYWGIGIPSVVLAESSDQGATFKWIAYLDHSANLEGNRPNPRPAPLQAVQAIATGPGNQTGMQSLWVLWEERTQSGTNALYVSGANVSSQGAVQTLTTKTSIFSEPQATPLYGVGSLAVGPNGKVAASYEVNGAPPYLGIKVDTGGVSGSFVSEQSVSLPSNFNFPYYIKPQILDGVSANATLAWDYSGGANSGTLYLVDLEQSTIYARYSTNNGTSWSAATQVSNLNVSGDRFLPSASLDESSGNLAVTWYDAQKDPSDISVQLFGSVGSVTNGSLLFPSNVQISGNGTLGQGFSSGWSSDSPPIRFSTGSNTSTTLNDTTQTWRSNQFSNVTLSIAWGTGKGEGTVIQSNSATQLFISPAWVTIPDTTSAYVIGGNQYEFGAFIGVSFVNGTFYTAWADNSGYAGGTAGGPLDIYTSAVTYSGPLVRINAGGNSNVPLPPRNEVTTMTLPTLRLLEMSVSATGPVNAVPLSASNPILKASASGESIAEEFFAQTSGAQAEMLPTDNFLILMRANPHRFDKLHQKLINVLALWNELEPASGV